MTSTSSRTFHSTLRRRRLAAAVALGLSTGLVLSACGTGGEPPDAPSTTAGSPANPVEVVTESASPAASATQTYTTRSGVFTWTFPETWTASQEDYSEDLLDYQGVPYEEVLFQDPEQSVEFRATTGVGPTDNDGPKPDVVEVLDAEELPGIPVNEGENAMRTGPVWYRATLLQANEAVQDSESFDGQEFLLSLQVVNIPEDIDPEGTDDSFWSAWFYEQPPAEGFEHGTASFLAGTISQDTAENTTGLKGEEALRAVLDTEEYATLRAVMSSMEVKAP